VSYQARDDSLAIEHVRAVDRTFGLWVLVGLAFPFCLGVALSGLGLAWDVVRISTGVQRAKLASPPS